MKRFTLSNLKQVFELLLGKMAEITTAFQSTVDEIYENIDQIESGEVHTDSATVGGSAHPVYLSDNTIKACTSTVGNDAHPVYMSVGTFTTCAATVGAEDSPIYMKGGTFTQSTATIGDETTPVYLEDGVFTPCDLSLDFGDDVTEEDIDAIFDE